MKNIFTEMKNTISKVLLAAFSSVLFFSCTDSIQEAAGCYPSEDGGTYIIINDVNLSRTINPSKDSLSGFDLRGKLSTQSEYKSLQADSNGGSSTIADLLQQKIKITPGIWDLMLTADSIADGSCITYEGRITKTIAAGYEYVLNFNLTPQNPTDFGEMKITVNFTGNADKVTAVLKNKSTDSSAIISKDFTGSSITSNND